MIIEQVIQKINSIAESPIILGELGKHWKEITEKTLDYDQLLEVAYLNSKKVVLYKRLLTKILTTTIEDLISEDFI